MPTNESRLAAAMMPPLSFSAGRCWMSALTGTAKNPAQKPREPRRTAEPMRPGAHVPSSDAGAGHADGAERDEAVLDLVAAEQAGDHAADADADGERGVEIAGFGLADVQNVGSVDDDGGEEQRAEKPEVGIAEHGEEERLIPAHELDLLPEIAEKLTRNFFSGAAAGTWSMPRLVAGRRRRRASRA